MTAESWPAEVVEEKPRRNFFQRLKSGLAKTRQALGGGLSRVILGRKTIDDELMEEKRKNNLECFQWVDAILKKNRNTGSFENVTGMLQEKNLHYVRTMMTRLLVNDYQVRLGGKSLLCYSSWILGGGR